MFVVATRLRGMPEADVAPPSTHPIRVDPGPWHPIISLETLIRRHVSSLNLWNNNNILHHSQAHSWVMQANRSASS